MAVPQHALPFARRLTSSGTPERIRFWPRRTGLLEQFDDDTLFSATMVQHGKPAPDLFQLAATRVGRGPNVCAVFGSMLMPPWMIDQLPDTAFQTVFVDSTSTVWDERITGYTLAWTPPEPFVNACWN